MVFSAIFLNTSPDNRRNHGVYNAPTSGFWGTLCYSVFLMLISLPAVVITYRAITTPHRLPYFRPFYALRILLTPTERTKPWILYLTPGLLATELLHIAYFVLGLRTLRHLLLPSLSGTGRPSPEDVSTTKLIIYCAIAFISTTILCPLEVIATKLAVQRNHASPEFNSVAQEEEGDAEELAEYSGAEEDVIGLRSEEDPYLGLVDCFQRIVQEEGWRALYRGWWVTMLFGTFGAFA
ncbi:hypothetical protein FA95DRAFT_1558767 [Auriscalpium vulgare]|uniref:Uncharacterized protein n=1 Tax=Auriscalpium vulgare TaxID=40419 RepID=A0ACB8RVZ8_9AGAM|nr:hypothetical protein FA95DRAFT_1558767 [Auriscalpium vulgare]